MTKARTPDSFADAMGKVIALLGAGEAARIASEAAGRAYAERTMYEWANPDSGTLPSLPIALALDTAYQLGVQKALEDAGYKSAAEVQQEVQELGLNLTPEAPKTAADNSALAELQSKLAR